jgi:hypothetical protein
MRIVYVKKFVFVIMVPLGARCGVGVISGLGSRCQVAARKQLSALAAYESGISS